MITATSRELFDVESAAPDILMQLDAGGGLLKNSVGIISCATEFIENGLVEILCGKLPFDVVGITTRGNAAGGQYGFDLLCLSVLTSDDVSFSTILSQPLSPDNIEAPIKDAFDRASQSGEPSFILAYPPRIMDIGAGAIFDRINRFSGDVPVFGSLSCDETALFTSCKTIWNGQVEADAMAMIFMYGEVTPRFFAASLPAKSLLKEYGIVTESESWLVKRVNNMLFSDFLKSLGLTGMEIFYMFPFIINFKNYDTPFVVSLYSVTPEGYGVFGNDIPAGSSITIGGLDYNGIMGTAGDALKSLFGVGEKISCALMYSCVGRNMILGPQENDELAKTVDVMGNRIPYHICYSGGEICPVKNREGILENHFHNYTFTVCAFEYEGPGRKTAAIS
jgi:hypothetical protein